VTVVESGAEVRAVEVAALESRDARGVVGFKLIADSLRDSLNAFFAFLSASRASLFITSAKAFPTEAKFKECRSEVRLGRGARPSVALSEGIVE
jgi:hypothetical protein